MRLPNNYAEAMERAKEKAAGSEKFDTMKPIADKIVEIYDGLSDTQKAIIKSIMKDFVELIEKLKEAE